MDYAKQYWRGRIEILERPTGHCDGAHNPDGAKSTVRFFYKIILQIDD